MAGTEYHWIATLQWLDGHDVRNATTSGTYTPGRSETREEVTNMIVGAAERALHATNSVVLFFSFAPNSL